MEEYLPWLYEGRRKEEGKDEEYGLRTEGGKIEGGWLKNRKEDVTLQEEKEGGKGREGKMEGNKGRES